MYFYAKFQLVSATIVNQVVIKGDNGEYLSTETENTVGQKKVQTN